MKVDVSASLRILVCLEYQLNLLLVTYQRKVACIKCRCKRTIFHNKGELKCCSYHKHFDPLHYNISEICLVEAFAGSKRNLKLILMSKYVLLVTALVTKWVIRDFENYKIYSRIEKYKIYSRISNT